METQANNLNQKTEDHHNPKKKGKNMIKKITGSKKLMGALILITVAGVIGGIYYFQTESSRIFVEKSSINAPIISLTPSSDGVLDRVLVKEGDKVAKGKVVAYMAGDIPITAGASGTIIYTANVPGQMISTSTPVVKMIEPKELRVVGQVEEDKGLADIKIGQKVIFTVDAYGSKQYKGIVDSITPSANTGSVVFSISDKREEKSFNVNVKFDTYAYPELLNGMSARMWIYK